MRPPPQANPKTGGIGGGSPPPPPPLRPPPQSSPQALEPRAKAMTRLMTAFTKSGLAAEDLRKRANELYGKTSSNELTDEELRAFADEIEGLILATAQAGASPLAPLP